MTLKVLVVVALTALLAGCGGAAEPSGPRRAAVPDVRGLDLSTAAARLIDARYCVKLKLGRTVDDRPAPGSTPSAAKMIVRRESPPAGSTRRTWAVVTLTVDGASRHATTYVDVWKRGTAIPCAPITTNG